MVRTDTPAESGVERPVEMAAVRWSCRNGTELLETLPLWREPDCETAMERCEDGPARKCTTATALNCEECCRCGKWYGMETALIGLQDGCHAYGLAATAPNRGICCRCGGAGRGICRRTVCGRGHGKLTCRNSGTGGTGAMANQ